MRVLITGAGGMLGTELVKALSEKHELVLVDKKPLSPDTAKKFRVINVDITDAGRFYEKATSLNPDIIIHTAACTDVDGSEGDADSTYRVNAIGTRNVALACQRFDAVMLYLSTDYVFDGTKGEPYTEFDRPNPQSVYAKSKYRGEQYVRWLLNRFYIIRTSGLYGKDGNNFVSAILKQIREKEELQVVNDQFISPTYTKDLAGAIEKLLGTQLYGIWHLTNGGCCSWYEFTEEIMKITATKKKLRAISTGELNSPAMRPGYSGLNNYLWELQGFTALRDWRTALKEFIEQEIMK